MCQIAEQIEEWMADLANNCIEPGSDMPAFASPLVGFARGEDELFNFLKTDIGPDCLLDSEGGICPRFPGCTCSGR